jgi:hypothetical protein
MGTSGWGNSTFPVVDVTSSLPGLRLAYQP